MDTDLKEAEKLNWKLSQTIDLQDHYRWKNQPQWENKMTMQVDFLLLLYLPINEKKDYYKLHKLE